MMQELSICEQPNTQISAVTYVRFISYPFWNDQDHAARMAPGQRDYHALPMILSRGLRCVRIVSDTTWGRKQLHTIVVVYGGRDNGLLHLSS
jgi:hypothetical protein